jgi:hypothetical protein
MRLLRHYFLTLGRRVARFCLSQTVIVPIILFATVELWQTATGRLTWESLQRNPWNEFMPYIATVGLFLGFQSALSARDLNRERAAEALANPPKIIHKDNELRRPSKWPPRVLAGLLICLICVVEGVAVERGYPQDALVFALLPPKPPTEASAPRQAPPPMPDVTLKLVNPLDASFQMCNSSNTLVRDAKYTFVLMDLDVLGNHTLEDGTRTPDILPIPTETESGDFLKKGTCYLQRALVSSFPNVQRIVKARDRVFGYGVVSCAECAAEHRYWIYFQNGVSGWYSEIAKATMDIPFRDIVVATDATLDKLVPKAKRTPIL